MGWIVFALLCMSTASWADARLVQAQPGRLVQAQPKALPKLEEGLCDHVLHAARLGISSGKVVIMERGNDGRPQPIGARLGDARVTPAFDLTFHSAAMVARIVF